MDSIETDKKRFITHAHHTTLKNLDSFDLTEAGRKQDRMRLLMVDGTEPLPHLETAVSLVWNKEFLFVFFQGKYETLRKDDSLRKNPQTGKTHHLWDYSDVYELFIGKDARLTKQYKEFQIAPNERQLEIAVDRSVNEVEGDYEWISGFRNRSVIDQERKIWYAGMEIPWKSLVDGKIPQEFDCNFYRATGKFHGDELLAWSPTGYGNKCYHRAQFFGTMKIIR